MQPFSSITSEQITAVQMLEKWVPPPYSTAFFDFLSSSETVTLRQQTFTIQNSRAFCPFPTYLFYCTDLGFTEQSQPHDTNIIHRCMLYAAAYITT